MKKSLLILFSSLMTVAYSQPYFQEDFNNGSLTANNAWVVFDVIPALDGNGNPLTWFWQDYNGSQWARVGNYDNGNNETLETWLITPSIDLTGATMPTLTFENTKRFAGDDLEVLVSTDYTGSGDPTSATWTDITAQANLDTDINSWSMMSSDDVDLSAYNNQTIYVAYKYVGSNTDGSTYQIDDVLIDEPTVPSNVSIYDIQYTTDVSGASPEEGNTVITGGIVTGVMDAGNGYFIQENAAAWSGIFVFDSNNTPVVGDSIIIEGEVVEYNGYTQISYLNSFSIESSGNASPAPITVSISDAQEEDYEGVIVRVEDATCTNDNLGFGNWEVSSGGTSLIVGKFIYGYSSQTMNVTYHVQGIMYFAFGEVQILTRDNNDVEVSPNSSVSSFENVEWNVYPNPAIDKIKVSYLGKYSINIIDLSGKTVINIDGNNDEEINLSGLNSGVYFIQLKTKNETFTTKLIKQ